MGTDVCIFLSNIEINNNCINVKCEIYQLHQSLTFKRLAQLLHGHVSITVYINMLTNNEKKGAYTCIYCNKRVLIQITNMLPEIVHIVLKYFMEKRFHGRVRISYRKRKRWINKLNLYASLLHRCFSSVNILNCILVLPWLFHQHKWQSGPKALTSVD